MLNFKSIHSKAICGEVFEQFKKIKVLLINNNKKSTVQCCY